MIRVPVTVERRKHCSLPGDFVFAVLDCGHEVYFAWVTEGREVAAEAEYECLSCGDIVAWAEWLYGLEGVYSRPVEPVCVGSVFWEGLWMRGVYRMPKTGEEELLALVPDVAELAALLPAQQVTEGQRQAVLESLGTVTFNRFDLDMVKSLLKLQKLSDKQALLGKRILAKYRDQLTESTKLTLFGS